ncbi:MAG: tetratricopeptide repeat protein [bacterium]|nr:tetratricopeptide repeat protein [bacterium]
MTDSAQDERRTQRSSAAPTWGWGALACGVLVAVTLFVYAPNLDHDFVTMDDYPYVVENEAIAQGLTLETVGWAFRSFRGSSWFPLTWLSFALDHDLGGLDPRVYHRTNIVLHAAGVALLYFALSALTGARTRSLLVACVFALHPLHVESVAWIAERKDVLSALFFMLALWGWARFAERPSVLRYALVMVATALGLLAKSSLVTLPFVLLLLDVWPLGRRALSWPRLIAEKLPLLALALGAASLTWYAGASGAALEAADRLGVLHRVGNAAIAYTMYLRDSFWPAELAPFYPHPGVEVSIAGSFLAAAVLVAITAFVIARWRAAPHLAVGWFWFVGMLIPMIGLVQAGPQARADRFVHLPQIGLCIALVWSLPAHWARRRASAIAAVVVVAAMAFATRGQLTIWQDGTTLFERVVALSPDSGFARHGLGQAYLRAGHFAEAEPQFRAALEAAPRWSRPMVALAGVLEERGDLERAAEWNARAVEVEPENLEFRALLAERLVAQGAFDRARPHLERLATHEGYPGRANAHLLLAAARERVGDVTTARRHYRLAVALRPELSEAHVALATLAFKTDDERAGIASLRRAVEAGPDSLVAVNNLAWHLATARDESLRRPQEALEYAERAAVLSQRSEPSVLETLAVALEANGLIERALSTLDDAIALARERRDIRLARVLDQRRSRLARALD